MSRRRTRKQTSLKDEFTSTAIALAAVGYFLLTADKVFTVGRSGNQYLNMMIYWGTPLALLAFAGIVLTALNNKRDHQRLVVMRDWQALTPQKYEDFVAAIFLERGFKARVVGGSGDDGIDIELYKANGLSAVVQVQPIAPVDWSDERGT